jgi:predicted CoA-substrate-specific enzyme activase
MVIDIGGQDSKVIGIDVNGLVAQFAMNDRCAAGTGKFLEVLARAVNVDLADMGAQALSAKDDIHITSMCATFAETEVISLLAEGVAKPEILGGVHSAIAKRTIGLVARVGKREPAVMTGGVAKNIAAVKHLERALDIKLIIPPDPQIAGALGAALFALDDYRNEGASLRKADEKLEVDLEAEAAAMQNCAPACATKIAAALAVR